MIDFLRTWANQIIVSVIIATIFEMLLPNGNNKKYIKMIIGIYVLFTIIEPIITKVTGNNLDISSFNYEKYFDKETIETTSQDFEDNNSKLIREAYIDSVENDIRTKIKQKEYEVINISIDIIENENQDTYGTIENINLKIKKIEKDEEKVEEGSNNINIENVDVNIINSRNESKDSDIEEKSNISEKEKIQIIEYLSKEYLVEKKNILIN